MPLYVLNCRDGRVRASYERSPAVTLATDAADAGSVPDEVRAAADSVMPANVDPLRNSKVPNGADGVLVWLENEQLLEGSAAMLRRNLRTPGRRAWLPVHYSYLHLGEPCPDQIDLIALQPRAFVKGKPHDYWALNLRVRSPGAASEKVLAALRAAPHTWARLSLLLLQEATRPGTAIEGLEALSREASRLSPALAALTLRNLVVVLVRHREFARAGQFLEQGINTYEGYAELAYLAALLCFRDGHSVKARHYLEKAASAGRAFVGGGGENTYRLSWLQGLQALAQGNEQLAFRHLASGLGAAPIFRPAVEEMLKLRVPPEIVEKFQWNLCHAARREPQFLEKAFDFLLRHRTFRAAQRLVETLPLTEQKRAELEERLERARAPFQPGAGAESFKPGVILEGPFLEHSSLARINREIGNSLLQTSALDAALEPSACASLLPQAIADYGLIRSGMERCPARLDLTIRQKWPPHLGRPARGRLAVILPWEYGAVPRLWIEQINRNVDELWLPSRFVRDVFVRCGVSQERIAVIPNGIDPNLFTPAGPSVRPQAVRKFMFLFVGGAIRRKGIDLLLDAYREAFEPGEDVSFLVVALGVRGAYQHNSILEQIQRMAYDPAAPHVELLTGELDDATLARLYRGCDAFVLPYRAEGFCMPVLEAMACGKPVITTAAGPSADFCTTATAYLVPARECLVPEEPPRFGDLVGRFTWFEPDAGELACTLRRVYENREEAARRGAAAAEKIRQTFRWPVIAKLYRERMGALLSRGSGGALDGDQQSASAADRRGLKAESF